MLEAAHIGRWAGQMAYSPIFSLWRVGPAFCLKMRLEPQWPHGAAMCWGGFWPHLEVGSTRLGRIA